MTRIATCFFGIFLLFFSSCSNEFDVTAPYKQITVVYGLLNASDSVQYIKINKAFLNDKGNALEIAKNPDSLYHRDKLKVMLKEMSNGNVLKTIILDTAVVPKEPGAFAGPNQLLYKTPKGVRLNADRNYKLEIRKKADSSLIASSSTEVVNSFELLKSHTYLIFRLDKKYYLQTFQWKPVRDGRMYEMKIRFYYDELLVGTTDTVHKYLDWNVFDNLKSTGTQNLGYTINGEDFYKVVQGNLDPVSGIERYAKDSLDVTFYVAGQDYTTYITLNQPNYNFNDTPPEFSNIEGGIGLFSSRNHKKFSIQTTPESLKELIYGDITGDLGFKEKL